MGGTLRLRMMGRGLPWHIAVVSWQPSTNSSYEVSPSGGSEDLGHARGVLMHCFHRKFPS